MAFEAFRAQNTARPRKGRRLTYALSIAVHAALIAVGVVYSFWHVEELSPPGVHVTFMSAAPPPPPPPPPPAGGGAAKKKTVTKPKPTVVPKVPDIVQPRETPPPEKPKHDEDDDEDDGEKGGVKGGTIGGVAGGTIGGTVGGTIGGIAGGVIGGSGTATVAPKNLAPNMGANQKAAGTDPDFPVSLRRAGVTYRVLAWICVSPTGGVTSVTIKKGADPMLDENVVKAVKSWRYRPLTANNTPVPFCYPHMFEFKGQ